MGKLIGLLALLNVVVLLVGMSMESVRDQPAALLGFNADKVRLLGKVERPQADPAPVVEPVADAVEEVPAPEVVAEPALPAEPTVPTVPVVPASGEGVRCLVWPALEADVWSEIEVRLKNAGIKPADFDMRLDKPLGWWVYLPPFPSAEAARAEVEALRRRGVRDLAPVRGGALVNAVSLGVFPTLEKARAHADSLVRLGLEDMRIGPRPKSGTATLVISPQVAASKLTRLTGGWGRGQNPQVCEER